LLLVPWLVNFGSHVSYFCGPSSYLCFVGVGFVDAPSVSADFALCNHIMSFDLSW
jgi:hypothetical protein